jgi:prepilin-type N-terminal cleavage/methylation domain-containing protein
MKKGFTIIELLVASLLLGMLVSVLTMLFNQSSIAWRTGVATIVDMDVIRDDIASIREEADNVLLAPETNEKMFMVVSPWDENGDLRKRAVNSSEMGGDNAAQYMYSSMLLYNQASYLTRQNLKASDFTLINCGSTDSAKKSYGYTVGVTSAGPDRRFGSYDDITSWPEEC